MKKITGKIYYGEEALRLLDEILKKAEEKEKEKEKTKTRSKGPPGANPGHPGSRSRWPERLQIRNRKERFKWTK